MIQKLFILTFLTLALVPIWGASQDENNYILVYEAPSVGFTGNEKLRKELDNFLYEFAAKRKLQIETEDNSPLFYMVSISHQRYGYGWGVVDVANYVNPEKKGVLSLAILSQQGVYPENLLKQIMRELKKGLEEKFDLSFQISRKYKNK